MTCPDPYEQWLNNEKLARKKVLKVFKNKRSDFDTEAEYEDALTEIEDMIIMLTDTEHQVYSEAD